MVWETEGEERGGRWNRGRRMGRRRGRREEEEKERSNRKYRGKGKTMSGY